MKCSFCGYEFAVSEGDVDCPGCPLRGNCGYVRCPRCGYDNLREAALVGLLRSWAKRWRESTNDERPTINGDAFDPSTGLRADVTQKGRDRE